MVDNPANTVTNEDLRRDLIYMYDRRAGHIVDASRDPLRPGDPLLITIGQGNSAQTYLVDHISRDNYDIRIPSQDEAQSVKHWDSRSYPLQPLTPEATRMHELYRAEVSAGRLSQGDVLMVALHDTGQRWLVQPRGVGWEHHYAGLGIRDDQFPDHSIIEPSPEMQAAAEQAAQKPGDALLSRTTHGIQVDLVVNENEEIVFRINGSSSPVATGLNGKVFLDNAILEGREGATNSMEALAGYIRELKTPADGSPGRALGDNDYKAVEAIAEALRGYHRENLSYAGPRDPETERASLHIQHALGHLLTISNIIAEQPAVAAGVAAPAADSGVAPAPAPEPAPVSTDMGQAVVTLGSDGVRPEHKIAHVIYDREITLSELGLGRLENEIKALLDSGYKPSTEDAFAVAKLQMHTQLEGSQAAVWRSARIGQAVTGEPFAIDRENRMIFGRERPEVMAIIESVGTSAEAPQSEAPVETDEIGPPVPLFSEDLDGDSPEASSREYREGVMIETLPPPPPSPPFLARDDEKMDYNPDVEKLQVCFSIMSPYPWEIDGIEDPEFRRSVGEYMAEHDIDPQNYDELAEYVGEQLRTDPQFRDRITDIIEHGVALEREGIEGIATSSEPSLLMKEAQHVLNVLGFTGADGKPLEITGRLDEDSQAAYDAFTKDINKGLVHDAAPAQAVEKDLSSAPDGRKAIEGAGESVEVYDSRVADLQRALIAANPDYRDVLSYTRSNGETSTVDGLEGFRTRAAIEDYAAQHDLDPREMSIEDFIKHVEDHKLTADASLESYDEDTVTGYAVAAANIGSGMLSGQFAAYGAVPDDPSKTVEGVAFDPNAGHHPA